MINQKQKRKQNRDKYQALRQADMNMYFMQGLCEKFYIYECKIDGYIYIYCRIFTHSITDNKVID